MRYGSSKVTATKPRASAPAIRMRWRSLPPPAQYALTKMPTMMIEVPRSGSSKQEDDRPGQHRRERNEHLVEVAHALGVAIDPVRDENGECELAQLRGLKRSQRPGVEPTSCAVHGDPEMRHEDEQHQHRGRHRARGRERPDAPVVDAAEHEQRDEADEHPGGLPFGVVEGRLVLVVGKRDARARDHDQAAAAQSDGGEQQQPVGLRSGSVDALTQMWAPRAPGAANRCRTSSLNRLPRSSKSLNMSKLL